MKMADQLKLPIHIHQHESESKQLQKQNGNATEENFTTEKKTITKINYDCLERIFYFLDLKSLLMVAQTCKRLKMAAAVKFGDDFGHMRIMMIEYMWLEVRFSILAMLRYENVKFNTKLYEFE